ncbi:MAG: pyruvate, phosphate dikinase/phosphoenolpyruvate synthase regulator [Mycetocola sp.]
MTAALTNAESAGPLMPGRTAFIVSDSTGITADTLATALIARFPGFAFDRRTIPFVDSEATARDVAADIHRASAGGFRPIVFLTVADVTLRQILGNSDAVIIDLLAGPLQTLEAELATKASGQPHAQHTGTESNRPRTRMRAVEYAIEHDDAKSLRALDVAELIIVAPSRCGKTATAMYLAIQFGLLVANVPLTDDPQEERDGLPSMVTPHVRRCLGLTSTPHRLHQVRSERYPNSAYASLQQCARELRHAEVVYRRHGIPFLNSAMSSVEETSAAIIRRMELRTVL